KTTAGATGVVSLPKFGVAVPLQLRAVSVAEKLTPALTVAGGVGYAEKANDDGAAMKLSVPVITRPASLPLPVYLPVRLIWPTSAYCTVVLAVPVASNASVTAWPVASQAAPALLPVF